MGCGLTQEQKEKRQNDKAIRKMQKEDEATEKVCTFLNHNILLLFQSLFRILVMSRSSES